MAQSVQKLIIFPGNRIDFPVSTTSTPNVEQTLVSETVPAGKKWKLWQVSISHRFEADVKVEHDSTIIRAARTGPGNYDKELNFSPPHPILAGESLLVKFRALSGEPPNSVTATVIITEESS